MACERSRIINSQGMDAQPSFLFIFIIVLFPGKARVALKNPISLQKTIYIPDCTCNFKFFTFFEKLVCFGQGDGWFLCLGVLLE
ncbi:hypothetical protein E2320_005631 [Naja naja]|nr:hypothetical protein E2320_005631 [Naja naja]